MRDARGDAAGVERGDQHGARAAARQLGQLAGRQPGATLAHRGDVVHEQRVQPGMPGYSASSASAMPSGSYSATGAAMPA